MSAERSDVSAFAARWVLGSALIVLALSLGVVALFLAIEGRFREAAPRRPAPTAAPALQTDETGDRFLYAQRQEIGPQVDRSLGDEAGNDGFDLAITSVDSATPPTASAPAWRMAGSNGSDRLVAALAPTGGQMNPASGRPAAIAGREQGRRAAHRAAALWL